MAEAGNLQKKFQEMSQAVQGQQKLMERMGELKGIQANIQRFRELKQSIVATGTNYTAAHANANKYAAIMGFQIEYNSAKMSPASFRKIVGVIPKNSTGHSRQGVKLFPGLTAS